MFYVMYNHVLCLYKNIIKDLIAYFTEITINKMNGMYNNYY